MRLVAASLALAAFVLAGSANATTVTIGTPNSSGCAPFTCGGSWQQVYGASAFSGVSLFDTVSFFYDQTFRPGDLVTGDLTITFYLTSSPVDGLSVDWNANRGQLLSNLGTFTLDGSLAPDVLSFEGAPFLYNPADGNLLMEMSVLLTAPLPGQLRAGAYQYAVDFSDQTSRYPSGQGGNADTLGLVTQFGFNGVPEPATWAMMLLGFGAVGVALRRNRRNGADLTKDSTCAF